MVTGRAPCIGVVHVPKSGGSAIRSALSQLPGCYTGPLYYDVQLFGSRAMADALPRKTRKEVVTIRRLRRVIATSRAATGHISAHNFLTAGCGALAVQLREPRGRLLSLYRFWQSQPADVIARWGRWGNELVAKSSGSFAHFLADEAVWATVDNAMSRQLLSDNRDDTAVRMRRHMRWGGWARRYRAVRPYLNVVDWANDSERFLDRLCTTMAAEARPVLRKENVTEVGGERQVLDGRTLDLLSRLTSYDRRLLVALMHDGLLPPRSAADLEAEFRTTAERLRFEVAA